MIIRILNLQNKWVGVDKKELDYIKKDIFGIISGYFEEKNLDLIRRNQLTEFILKRSK